MEYKIKEEEGFSYLDEGEGNTLILLHGLMGDLSNWRAVVEYFAKDYRVVLPLLPLYDMPLLTTGVKTLAKFLHKFVEHLGLEHFTIVGNSLGGHIALIYTLSYPDTVDALILTGSSGLYESAMGSSFPRRENYDFIKEKVEYTFYDPKYATKELVDEIFENVNNRNKVIRILAIAKSAIRHNMEKDLHKINKPVLIIWGKQDKITPPHVAEQFNSLLKDSELQWIDKCGHAPMMEHPDEFNDLVDKFLNKLY